METITPDKPATVVRLEAGGLAEGVYLWLKYVTTELPKARRWWAGGLTVAAGVASVLTVVLTTIPIGLRVILGIVAVMSLVALFVLTAIAPMGAELSEKTALADKVKRLTVARSSPESFYEAAAEVYGLTVCLLKLEGAVAADGSGTSHHVRTVAATTAAVRELEHRSTGGSTGGAPTASRTIRVHTDKCAFNPQVIVRKENANAVLWSLRFNPALPKSEKVTYSFTTTLPANTFICDSDKLPQGIQQEFWSADIKYPTEKLDLKIALDSSIALESAGYEVWCDRGKIRHESEFHRIHTEGFYTERSMVDERVELRLTVDHPILGLRYALVWRPASGTAVTPVAGEDLVALVG